jgi:tripartite-type tricarboxylate transporter receptor subunit TctC
MEVSKFFRPVLFASAGLAALSSFCVQAAGYPDHPITAIIAQAPGGGADTVGRLIMQKLSAAMGQAVIVENRAGAGGIIGTRTSAKAPADGYTLLFTSTSHVINPVLHKDAKYDAIKDFAPIALVAQGPFVLVANPGFEAKTTAELIALAKKEPGKIDYGSVGIGSFNHLLGEMLSSESGIKLQHVPYKGSAEAASAVVGGQVPLSFNSLAGALPFIKAGKLRALGVSSAKASALAPDIPPLSDAVPGFDGTSWYALMAPAGTPKPVVDKLAAEVKKILQDPEVDKLLETFGAEATYGDPAELTRFLQAQNDLWIKVIGRAGVVVDN